MMGKAKDLFVVIVIGILFLAAPYIALASAIIIGTAGAYLLLQSYREFKKNEQIRKDAINFLKELQQAELTRDDHS